MEKKIKLIRITTVPMALAYPLRGQPRFMVENGFDVILISAAGDELPKLADENCRHIMVPMTRQITPFRDLRCIFTLIKIFRKERPEIVHTETPKAGLLGMIAARVARVPVRIHTVAGLPLMVAKGLKFRVLKTVEKVTYAAATEVWPNSHSLENYIVMHRMAKADKLTVIGGGSSNGVDTERFSREHISEDILNEIKGTVHYDPKLCYLLFVGRLVRDKGITELIEVFTALQKQRPELRLILAGQYEPELDPLPASIEKEIHGNPAIIHIPWTEFTEYYILLANVFVFPSYREGFPNVLLEAAAMKLPIVCSRIAGNVDIVTDRETGIIFESQDATALQRALLFALENPTVMTEMAERLQQRIINDFSRPRFWKAMRTAYLEALEQSVAK